MYVLKDLVPDMSNFYEQHKSVQPYLITAEGTDESVENYQSKEDRAKLDGARQALPGSGGAHTIRRMQRA